MNVSNNKAAGVWVLVLGCALALVPVATAEEPLSPKTLRDLSLEDLMGVKVVSVSKNEETVFDAAAAAYVVTREDIERSGARTIADALRMVPGMQVGSIDASRWAVAARGFTNRLTNKLLVLIDGQSVYSPVFSGVHWEDVDLPLDSIDRIEVIRGPGGSIWGSNAVNGVINVITRESKDTEGVHVLAGGGTEDRSFAQIRFGERLSPRASFRVEGSYFDRASIHGGHDTPAGDGRFAGRLGGRLDWHPRTRDSISIKGSLHQADTEQNLLFDEAFVAKGEVQGGSIMVDWRHDFSTKSTMRIQSYVDRKNRALVLFGERRQTFDFEFDHSLRGERHEFIWGGGFRWNDLELYDSDVIHFGSGQEVLRIFNGFAQEQWSVVPKRLDLTLGTKIESQEYTGLELLPTARLRWRPRQHHVVWGSVARAVRSPSRTEVLGQFDLGVTDVEGLGPVTFLAHGNEDFHSEKMVAFEAGYRVAPRKQLSLDVAAFVNEYDDLRGNQVSGVGLSDDPVPSLVLNVDMVNSVKARSYGVESAVDWAVNRRWTLRGGYTFTEVERRGGGSVTDLEDAIVLGADHRHLAHIRSFFNATDRLMLDAALYWYGGIEDTDVEAFAKLDAHVGYQLTPQLRFSVVGQNLLEPRHHEFPDQLWELRTETERAVFASLRWDH